MVTNAARRKGSVWAMVCLGVALVAAALAAMVLSPGTTTTAQAQVEAQHPAADLHIRKTVKPRVVPVRHKQTFNIRVTNEGNRRARNVTMSDPLPNAVKFVRASTSRHVPGSCGTSRRTVVCRLGTLRVGALVTVKIIVKPTKNGGYLNRAFVEHTTGEIQSSDNTDLARARGKQR